MISIELLDPIDADIALQALGSTRLLRAVNVPAQASCEWQVSGPIAISGLNDQDTVRIVATAASDSLADAKVEVRATPPSGEPETASQELTVFGAVITPTGGSVLSLQDSAAFTASVAPASVQGVSWKWTAGVRIEVATGTDTATATVRPIAVSDAIGDSVLTLAATVGGQTSIAEQALTVFDVAVLAPGSGAPTTWIAKGGKAAYRAEVRPPGIDVSLDWATSAALGLVAGQGTEEASIQGDEVSEEEGDATVTLTVAAGDQKATARMPVTVFRSAVTGSNDAEPLAWLVRGGRSIYQAELVPRPGGPLDVTYSWRRGDGLSVVGNDNEAAVEVRGDTVSQTPGDRSLAVSLRIGDQSSDASLPLTVFAAAITGPDGVPPSELIVVGERVEYEAAITPAGLDRSKIAWLMDSERLLPLGPTGQDQLTLKGLSCSTRVDLERLTLRVTAADQVATASIALTVFDVAIRQPDHGEPTAELPVGANLRYEVIPVPQGVPLANSAWAASDHLDIVDGADRTVVTVRGTAASDEVDGDSLSVTANVHGQARSATLGMTVFDVVIRADDGGVPKKVVGVGLDETFKAFPRPANLNVDDAAWAWVASNELSFQGSSTASTAQGVTLRGTTASGAADDADLRVSMTRDCLTATATQQLTVFSVAIRDADGARPASAVITEGKSRSYRAVPAPDGLAVQGWAWEIAGGKATIDGVADAQDVKLDGTTLSAAVGDATLTVRMTADGTRKSASQALTVGKLTRIRATITATAAVTDRNGNAPANQTFDTANTARAHPDGGTLVVLNGNFPAIALTATTDPVGIPVVWRAIRNPDDAAEAGDADSLPTVTPSLVANNAARLATDNVGSFWIRAAANGFSDGTVDADTAQILLPLVMPRVELLDEQSVAHPANIAIDVNSPNYVRASTGAFNINAPDTAGLYFYAEIELLSGGADGKLMLDKVSAGWVNNLRGAFPTGAGYTDASTGNLSMYTNRGAATGARFAGSPVFLPNDPAPQAAAVPVLDTGRAPAINRGTGGRFATLTTSQFDDITPLPVLIGAWWAVKAVDSPGLPMPYRNPAGNRAINRYTLGIPFRAALAFWTNNSVGDVLGSPADRVYGVAAEFDWTIAKSWGIAGANANNPFGPGITKGAVARSDPIEPANARGVEVRAPVGFDFLAYVFTDAP